MNLTLRVLVAMALGVGVGLMAPEFAAELKFLSDLFVRLVKMLIPPIVFLTVVVGVANMGDLKKVGRLGAKTLLYFEVVTTLALGIGLFVVLLLKPGVGFDTQGASLADASQYLSAPAGGGPSGWRSFLLSIVPDSVVGALAKGDMLPVLLFATLFGLAMAQQGKNAKPLLGVLQRLADVFFSIIHMVMKLSPLAAFGAMAYTIGKFGFIALWSLAQLMVAVYATMALFIFVVLGGVARFYNFSLWRLLGHIKEELLLVLGTSSSESVLPNIMTKLEGVGCSKGVVGFVVPTGYAFNLDGTAIYLSMATMFIVQAYGVDLSWQQMATIMAVLMLTSKGAAGVTGSGFITLAATLAAMPGQPIPLEGVALVVGVDRFMSEARAITNLIGNCVASIVIAKAEGEFCDQGIIGIGAARVVGICEEQETVRSISRI